MSIKSKYFRSEDEFIQDTIVCEKNKLSCSASCGKDKCKNPLKYVGLKKRYNFNQDRWDIYVQLRCISPSKAYAKPKSHQTLIVLDYFLKLLSEYNESYFSGIKKNIENDLKRIKDFEKKKLEEIKINPASHQILNTINEYWEQIFKSNEKYYDTQQKCTAKI